ncbi:heavy-metal-associated domain-containing protein [Actinomarinicola tropica]|uniref:HMA domain-containing protein n=1 Tax=Actinomarinicola tropica TaxID=2789776 RepID=A0A5Q2RQW6_9ACTN|nr:heavy-metal-associated domain-containing protein [Actinomarinicola tropica]QGG96290.1 hypothetical protein GH723_14955 [Actinomarinicola tropica]
MTNSPEPTIVTFSTPTVHCGSCLANISDALDPLEGIVSTETDLDSKSVKVAFDPHLIDATKIAALIGDAGYDVAGITG